MNPSLLVFLFWALGTCSLGFGLLFIFLHGFEKLKKLGIILSIIGAVLLIILFSVVIPWASEKITSAGSLVQQIFLFFLRAG